MTRFLTVTCWKWGSLFGPEYVNRLRAGLERHLHLAHRVVCVTDDARGIDRRVDIVELPDGLRHTPRCRRRMQVFSADFAKANLGDRILSIDLDVVIVNDITPIVDRREPFVGYRIGYAGAFSGAFHLHDAGVLDGLWRAFESDPEGYPRRASHEAVPSDQAMLNAYLRGMMVPYWTEAHGFVLYFGKGYEKLESFGVGPNRQELPGGARIVLLGGADKADMDAGSAPWIREHWTALPGEAA